MFYAPKGCDWRYSNWRELNFHAPIDQLAKGFEMLILDDAGIYQSKTSVSKRHKICLRPHL